jgi:hypothetical protein
LKLAINPQRADDSEYGVKTTVHVKSPDGLNFAFVPKPRTEVVPLKKDALPFGVFLTTEAVLEGII